MGRLNAAQVQQEYEETGGLLSVAEREQIVKDLRLWEFGKWALLGDDAGQMIRRQLQHRSSRGTPTFWESIGPMSDEEAETLDAWMCRTLPEMQRKVLKCAYQYHQGEDAGARVLRIIRWQFRMERDSALKKLSDAAQKA